MVILILYKSHVEHGNFGETGPERIVTKDVTELDCSCFVLYGNVNQLMGNSREIEGEAMRGLEGPPFDPRAVANLMLDVADTNGHPLTHLALQKLLYFAHGLFLVERKVPLVMGYFEAWEYGPVHPAIYQAFKQAQTKPISFRAGSVNLLTGARSPIAAPEAAAVRQHIGRIIAQFGRMHPARLVEISHANGAPWKFVMDKPGTSVSYGKRIGDDVISERFKYHKVSVRETPSIGEPVEDTPPS
jgi:uncharacterized phage-associated protein